MPTGLALIPRHKQIEQAHQHCQVGNLGLAIGFVPDWIAFHTAEDQEEPPGVRPVS